VEKILFVATIDQHIRHFHIPFLKWFKENNFEVHVASNGQEVIPYVNKKFNVPFERSPMKLNNIKAYIQLKKIINENDYRLIHCHTPMGGIIARLASREARRKGAKILYTAHGFHFYKGASLKNWLLYFPVEKWMSRYTDCLITINNEDYQIAKKNFGTKSIELVQGVGINTEKFKPLNNSQKLSLRQEYGYDEKDLILIYVAELSYRKNQHFLIEVVNLLSKEIPHVKLILVGKGQLENEYKRFINRLNVADYIDLLGYRTDVDKLMRLADISVSSSRQEGLPVNIMEAMATGLPVVVTDCRGNRDLVFDGKNGFVINDYDKYNFAQKIKIINDDLEVRQSMSQEGISLIREFSLERILEVMGNIYLRELGRDSHEKS